MAPGKAQVKEVAPGGEWLFRQAELTLGPVSGAQLVERLYAGEVTGQTPISPMGHDSWRALREVEGFKLHLAKAEAKLRVDATARAQAQEATRSRNRRLTFIGAVTLALAIPAAWAARYLAVHNPWKEQSAAGPEITVEAPHITLAQHGQEELAYYPLDGMHPGKRAAGGGQAGARAGGKVGAGTRTEADGMELAQFDKGAINNVVAAKQRTLYSCFTEEARRTPGLRGKFPIEFVIGNDGHVAKLWVDNPSYKEGPLADCLMKELQKWPFKPYEGERATVALSFQIGKPG